MFVCVCVFVFVLYKFVKLLMQHNGTLRKGELAVLCVAVAMGMDNDELMAICDSPVTPIPLASVMNRNDNNPLHLCVQRVLMQSQVYI